MWFWIKNVKKEKLWYVLVLFFQIGPMEVSSTEIPYQILSVPLPNTSAVLIHEICRQIDCQERSRVQQIVKCISKELFFYWIAHISVYQANTVYYCTGSFLESILELFRNSILLIVRKWCHSIFSLAMLSLLSWHCGNKLSFWSALVGYVNLAYQNQCLLRGNIKYTCSFYF